MKNDGKHVAAAAAPQPQEPGPPPAGLRCDLCLQHPSREVVKFLNAHGIPVPEGYTDNHERVHAAVWRGSCAVGGARDLQVRHREAERRVANFCDRIRTLERRGIVPDANLLAALRIAEEEERRLAGLIDALPPEARRDCEREAEVACDAWERCRGDADREWEAEARLLEAEAAAGLGRAARAEAAAAVDKHKVVAIDALQQSLYVRVEERAVALRERLLRGAPRFVRFPAALERDLGDAAREAYGFAAAAEALAERLGGAAQRAGGWQLLAGLDPDLQDALAATLGVRLDEHFAAALPGRKRRHAAYPAHRGAAGLGAPPRALEEIL